MAKAPWTLEEFAIVAKNPALADEDLAELLVDRSPNAVGIIRVGLHTFHMNEAGQAQRLFLPQVIRSHLGRADREKVVCARCGVRF